MNKAMWDFMDKAEGRKDSSFSNMNKERKRQGYKEIEGKKKETAKKMTSDYTKSLGHLRKREPMTFYSNKEARDKEMIKKSIRRHSGKESLNPAQKNRNDSEGQKSYKQEDT